MNKVHIAFGFHVNCYHSYRGDTADNLGFGSDIRIIRKIIGALDALNSEGVPVKGTWDCENFFSLEKILPQFAPDIIENMKRRTAQNGDEQIIMGYSNGALAPMTQEELEASVNLAVTNPEGSGLLDIFGKCEMLVRPQEVMFTPSQVPVYNKLGVKALCLYYSCVPFDAFRTIVPVLPDELAFNPLTYTYKGDSITVLPTYNNSDICDAGCLRAWVKELHKKQESGEIKHDVLIFVNMDADAIFWESMNLPVVRNKIANTDGINGLVREIADLPFIEFDTPGNYIKTHEALGNIEFTQDTADGNFTGYASWAEKPYNRKIWTAVDRSRALAKANGKDDRKSASFRDRVLLLSTTHFGLATPVLNIRREEKADELALSVVNSEKLKLKKYKKIAVYNTAKSNFQCVQMSVNEKIASASQIEISGAGLKDYTVIPTSGDLSSVFVMMRFDAIKDKYFVEAKIGESKKPSNEDELELHGKGITLKFSKYGKLYKVIYNKKEIGGTDFLKSFITFDGREYEFENVTCEALSLGGNGKGIRSKGEIHLPNEKEKGEFTFDFIAVDYSKGIFVHTDIKYPYTPEYDSISTENSSLGRYSDMKWEEAVPFQITPSLDGDISVVKRNFMGDISSYRTKSFSECDPKNVKLDSFNNHLTAGLIALTDGHTGVAVANARNVLGSMAHCPMRMLPDGKVQMNPFGTYYGKQRHHWSRANGEILDTYVYVTPQGKSIAPAYNGARECAMMALFGFEGAEPTGKTLCDITSFADGAVVSCPENSVLGEYYLDNAVPHKPEAQSVDEKKLKNPIASGLSGNLGKYITLGSRAVFHIVKAQIKSRK